jgi:trehalose-phosphatase
MTAVPLDQHLDAVAAAIAAPAHVLIALDFDGTLTPIVLRPSLAKIAEEVRLSVAALARQPRATVAVVSGRALADVRERVAVEGLVYAGNHGLEIEGSGFSFLHPGAENAAAEIDEVLAAIERGLDGISGVELEHKGLTASVHYRRVAPSDVLAVKLLVRRCVHEAAPTLLCREGKRVLEIRPAVHWHKGAAVAWIRERIGQPQIACLYVGDDRTDEDAFQALEGSVTVRVGDVADTAARYLVRDADAVHAFVRWLTERIAG